MMKDFDTVKPRGTEAPAGSPARTLGRPPESPGAAGCWVCRSIGARRMGESACQKKRPQRKGDAAGAVIPTDARGGEASGRPYREPQRSDPSTGAGGLSWGPPIPTAGNVETKAANGQSNYRNSVDRSELVWSTSVGGVFRSMSICAL